MSPPLQHITGEVVFGLTCLYGVSVGALLLLLKRLGLIKFGSNGYCKDHKTCWQKFDILEKEHLVRGEMLKNHDSQLREGKKIFREIKEDVSSINTNIAILTSKVEQRSPECPMCYQVPIKPIDPDKRGE